MNTDLTRLHSQNTLSLNNYVVTEELKFALHHSISSVVHTFSSFSTSSFSILDHFIVNEILFNRIQCYVTCDEIENQSNHLPLLITLDIDISIVNDVVINPPSTVRVPRQQWDRADITDRANYHDYLDNLLMSLQLPIECINCTDYYCTDYSHIASIQYYHDYLVESCLEASKVIKYQKLQKKSQAGMSMLNPINKSHNFGTLFGRNAVHLEMVKLLKL